MKIAVLGAGAVGCFYGGMLGRAGHEVVLIGRPAHVAAMAAHGLRLETHEFQERVAVQASVDPAAVHGARLVLFCVKSMDSEPAAAQIAPYLSGDALVLCLQNGVDNASRVQVRVPCAVAPVAVYVACEMAGPGHVRHLGRGDLVLAADTASALGAGELVRLFGSAGIAVALSDNVAGALWSKLIINCAYNALSAIGQLPYGRLVQDAGVHDLMQCVVHECQEVARAAGVSVIEGIWEAVWAIAPAMPEQYSSTAQDLARGRRSEIEHLNGYIVRTGASLGVPTPANLALLSAVRLLEGRASATH